MLCWPFPEGGLTRWEYWGVPVNCDKLMNRGFNSIQNVTVLSS